MIIGSRIGIVRTALVTAAEQNGAESSSQSSSRVVDTAC